LTARVFDAALVVMIVGAFCVLAMQAVSGDWFPPDVSISQYGVGRYGWMLTFTLLCLAAASALLLWGAYRLGSARQWRVVLPGTVWILALVVMAFVPTNEWPAPLSLTGQIHQAAAVLGLFVAPIGAMLMVGVGARHHGPTDGKTGRRAGAVAVGSALLGWFFLVLLLLTNIDIDVTGLGYQRAWSLHQTIAVVLDIIMVFALIISMRARAATARMQSQPSPVAFPATSRSVSR
jgi:hypothetical protein